MGWKYKEWTGWVWEEDDWEVILSPGSRDVDATFSYIKEHILISVNNRVTSQKALSDLREICLPWAPHEAIKAMIRRPPGEKKNDEIRLNRKSIDK